MKKFSTLALAASLTIGAWAASPVSIAIENPAAPRMPIVKKHATDAAVSVASMKKVGAKVAPEDGISAMEGTWEWVYEGLLNGSSGTQKCEVTITVDNVETGELTLTGLFDGDYVYTAIYNEEDGSLTIPVQQLGFVQQYNEYMVFTRVDSDETAQTLTPADEPLVLSCVDEDANSGSYYWYTPDVYCVVGRTADGTFTHADGWYALASHGMMTPAVEWEEAGMAQFFDNSGFTGLFGKGMTEPVELPLQKHPTTEGVYRIVGPWDNVFGGVLGTFFEFDMSNPECIVIPEQLTGIRETTLGAASVQSWSDLADQATLDELDYPYPYFNEETHTIEMPIGSVYTIFANDSESVYYVTEDNGGVADYIIMPESDGIQSVTGDNNADAPVIYYNLQGVQVKNPAGGVYIYKQGTRTGKVLVK